MPEAIEDEDLNEILSGLGTTLPPTPPAQAVARVVVVAQDDGDSAEEFLAAGVVSAERTVPDITKLWMKHHEFILVRSIQQLNEIVDAAIAAGCCALDLETEGLDNRIFYDTAEKPYTKHKIVGYCLSYDGHTGYYAPVRHNPEDGGTTLNLPIAEADAAITRLCKASQPVGVPTSVEKDPLSFREWGTPPKVILYFWNAKFDQEFLYPVTGIDWWHPDSFEDGNLLYFTYYSGDHQLSLKDKALHELYDIEGNPYEMIKLKELFVQGRRDIHFQLLAPDEPGCVKYAGSDAICTFLLCTDPRKHEAKRKPIMKLVKAKYNFTYRLEKQTSQSVRWMERSRVRVNKAKCEVLRVQNLEKRDALGAKIRALAEAKSFHGFEPSSSKQLSEFLFTDKGLNISLPVNTVDWPNGKPPVNEKSGQFKTDADTLESMLAEHPSPPEILQWVVDWRGFEKMNGTYLDNLVNNLDERSELRFQFKQTGAATGRFSAPAGDPSQGHSGIAIHGIPGTSAIREAFEARDGFTMVKADFAGEELRIAANVSGEMVWIKEFLEGDGDLHSITARAFFGKQNVSKEERGMGKCVHPDTLVYVGNSLISLRDALSFPDIEDTFQNAKAIIHDGDSWRDLTATFNGGTKPQVHVILSGGVLTCSENHRFEMRDGSFVRAADLQQGDLVRQSDAPKVTARPYPLLRVDLWEGLPPANYQLTHDLAYFAGLFVGDGTGSDSSAALTHGASGVVDNYGHDYEDWIQSLENSSRICGFTTSRKDKASLYLGSRVVVRFLRALGIQGKTRKHLRVPSWVTSSGKTAILHYLGGLFDTDGTVGVDSPNLDWTTKSFVLAGQVACAMRACGLDFNTELTFNKTYQRYYVRLRLTVRSSWQLHAFMKHVGKVSRLRPPTNEGKKKDRFEVVRVLPAGSAPCVDVSVGDSHRYLANGFVTHNTANFALIYGGGPAAIMRATGCDKLEATRRKQAFDKTVPAFAQWIKGQHAKVKKDKGVWTPLNRWIAIPDIDVPDPKVIAACERKSTNFPIQGAGADVMKFCLVLLCREFYKRKWIRQAGNDWIRMLLTVHDEIVFEIKHSLVQEALALICHVMASPAAIPKSPAWRVPLVVEPLIGLNWGAQYDYGMLMHGKPLTPDYKPYTGKNPKYKGQKFDWLGNSWSHLSGCPATDEGTCDCGSAKDIEIVVGDRVYHQVPPWLENLFIPPYLQTTTLVAAQVVPEEVVTAVVMSVPVNQVAPVSAPSAPKPSLVQPAPEKPVERARDVAVEVFCVKLGLLSYHTVRQVRTCIAEALDPDVGKVLCLLDGPSGRELIEPARGIRVIPEVFVKSMKELNLSNGEVFPYKFPGAVS